MLNREDALKMFLTGAEGFSSKPAAQVQAKAELDRQQMEGDQAMARQRALKGYLQPEQTSTTPAHDVELPGPTQSGGPLAGRTPDQTVTTPARYVPGSEQMAAQAEQDYSTKAAQDLESQYMRNHPGFHGTFRVGPHGTEISENQAFTNLKAFLTPAQEAAEKEAGQKIAAFEGGGKQSQESNIGQIQDVQNQIASGKRDSYDKFVGGALENHPTLMSFLAPTEKARRDQVQNAMLGMLHEAGIPRPTQWDIQRVFGQVYDPASDDKTNATRLANAVGKMQQQKSAAEQQSKQYHQTGFATMGGVGNPGLPPQGPAKSSPAPSQPQAAAPVDEQAAFIQKFMAAKKAAAQQPAGPNAPSQ